MEGRWREGGGKVEGRWREGGGKVEGRRREGGGKVILDHCFQSGVRSGVRSDGRGAESTIWERNAVIFDRFWPGLGLGQGWLAGGSLERNVDCGGPGLGQRWLAAGGGIMYFTIFSESCTLPFCREMSSFLKDFGPAPESCCFFSNTRHLFFDDGRIAMCTVSTQGESHMRKIAWHNIKGKTARTSPPNPIVYRPQASAYGSQEHEATLTHKGRRRTTASRQRARGPKQCCFGKLNPSSTKHPAAAVCSGSRRVRGHQASNLVMKALAPKFLIASNQFWLQCIFAQTRRRRCRGDVNIPRAPCS